MGCHTWSYVKFKPSDDAIEKMKNKFIEKYHHYMTHSPEEILAYNDRELKEKFPDYKAEDYPTDIGEFTSEVQYWRQYMLDNDILKKVESDDFSHIDVLVDDAYYLLGPDDDRMLLFYKGEWYVEDSSIASDMFRVGYSEEKFTDAESLIAWLKTQKYVGYYPCSNDNVGMCEELEKEIRDAFDEHPGLLIEFG